MLRRLVATAVALALVALHDVRAQEAGPAIAENVAPNTLAPGETTTAPVVTDPAAPLATTAPPIATEAVAATLVPTGAPTLPVTLDTPPPTTPPPTPTPVPVTAAPVADASLQVTPAPPTTVAPTATPSLAQGTSETNTTKPLEKPRTFRGVVAENRTSSSLSSSQDGAADNSTSTYPTLSSSSEGDTKTRTSGTLKGFSFSKTVAISVLGSIGLLLITILLCVVCKARGRDFPDLTTPTLATNTFPSALTNAPTSPSSSVWKSNRSTFASRDLPLASSIRAKLNANTRSPIEYDRPHPISMTASRPHDTSTLLIRQSNISDRSLSLRGCSEFSVHHQGDSDVSGRYSTSDRYSTKGRYSTTSRLSSEFERSNSGVPPLVPKAVDASRVSSSSSTPSSAAARRHNRVSLANHDRIPPPRPEDSHATDGIKPRTDVPDWYRVIKSPADTDRYTTTSLVSENASGDPDSFEL